MKAGWRPRRAHRSTTSSQFVFGLRQPGRDVGDDPEPVVRRATRTVPPSPSSPCPATRSPTRSLREGDPVPSRPCSSSGSPRRWCDRAAVCRPSGLASAPRLSSSFAPGRAPRRSVSSARSPSSWTYSYPNRPFTHRWPSVTEWSWGEVTLTIRLSCTCSSRLQPTPQYEQIVVVTVCRSGSHISASRSSCSERNMSAPVGHTPMQLPQNTQAESVRPTSNSVEMRASNPGRPPRWRRCSGRPRRTPRRTCNRGCSASSRGRTAGCRS
jgi:hypothetical protein